MRDDRAGNAIISKNLVGANSLNAMLPGRHVTAIFGFCDIRKFTDTTGQLRQPCEILTFDIDFRTLQQGNMQRLSV
jgi:hypothetical protein